MRRRIIYKFLKFCIVTEFNSSALDYLELLSDKARKFGFIKDTDYVDLVLLLAQKFAEDAE